MKWIIVILCLIVGIWAADRFTTADHPKSTSTKSGPGEAQSSPAHATTREAPSPSEPQTSPAPAQIGSAPAVAPLAAPTVSDTPIPDLGQHNRNLSIIIGDTKHRLLLFTFDDGPDAGTTVKLLERLEATGVKALFFLSGERMAGDGPVEVKQRAIAQMIAAKGHIIGNHTFHHYNLLNVDESQLREEIDSVEAIFIDLFGQRSWLLRPPGGVRSKKFDQMMRDRGYTTVLWNLGSGDFQVTSAVDAYETWKKILDRREKANGVRGGIILLHDTHPWIVRAYQLIFEEIQDRNCKLVQEEQELYDIVDQPYYFSSEWLGDPSNAEILKSRQRRLRGETIERCSSAKRAH